MKKNKPSKVKFINTLPKMKNVFPEPEPSSKNIPSWYKKVESFYDNDPTPNNGNQQLTVKRCVAFLDVLSSGYILKAPFDIYVDTTQESPKFDVPEAMKALVSIGNKAFLGAHDLKQVPGYPFDHDQYVEYLFRVNMIWVVETDPGYSALFINPQHHDVTPFFAISAIIDTDTYPSNGLMSFLVKKNFKGVVPKGTPLMQVIPFKREEYISEYIETKEKVSEVNRITLFVRSVFNSGYKKFLWHKKSYR
jgi:hypothetical protein